MERQRHQKKDYELLLRDAESHGWRVTRTGGYFKCYCPCADKHYVQVVLTPSGSRTLLNTRKDFERASCWEGGKAVKVEVTMRGRLVPGAEFVGDPEEAMDQALDLVMADLLNTVEDPGLSGSLADGAVEVRVTVTASALAEGVATADAAIRAALHAANVTTDGWDDVRQLRVEWHQVEADDLIDA